MLTNLYLNQSIYWAVSDDAKTEINRLVSQGLDFDLAFTLVEEGYPEGEFWINPEQEVPECG